MKLNKKISYLIFIFVVFFASITGVKAGCTSETNKCLYNFEKNGKKYNLNAHGKSDKAVTSLDNLEFCSESGSIVEGGEKMSRQTGLFVIEDGKLYCPDVVYFCTSGKNRIITDQSTCKDSKYLYTATRTSTSGFGVGYTASRDGDKLQGCKKDGKKIGEDAISKLNGITLPTADNITAASAKSAITSIKKVADTVDNTNNNYCFMDKINEASKLAEDMLSKIDEAIKNSTKLTDEEKAELGQKVSETKSDVSLSLGKLGSVASLGSEQTCFVDGLLSAELKEVLQFALNIIRIAVPILLIILVAVDFGSAVISNDKDITAKVVSKVVKRIIAALVVFFIPTIVGILLDMPGISDWTSTDAACMEKLDNN